MSRQRCGVLAAMLCGLALAIVVAGCSGSDKGNGPTDTLTKGEQYEELQPFLEDLVPSTIDEFGGKYWDGIDSGEISDQGMLVPGMGKRMAVESDTIAVVYHPLTGWWVISAVYSVDSAGVAGHVELRDSVRFETASGVAQVQPDTATYRFRRGGRADAEIESSEDGVEVTAEFLATRSVDVTGLNGDVVTVNGASAGSFNMHGTNGTGTADFGFEFETGVQQVKVTTDPANPCPTDGTMHINVQIDFDVRDDSSHAQAKGEWEAEVDFTGNGVFHLEVNSGDFHAETSDTLSCAPPL